MGVERFFSSIRSDFKISEISKYPFKKISSKYIFIDFNSIVHVISAHLIKLYNLKISETKYNKDNFEIDLIEKIELYLIELFKNNIVSENLEYIYICIDGVPTMGKIYEQKKRRYMASLISFIGDKQKLKKNKFKWEKNNISPGTEFMNKLEIYLNSNEFKNKIKKTCPNLKDYILSGTNERGEGEMKIINIIKDKNIKEDTIVYSPDNNFTYDK